MMRSIGSSYVVDKTFDITQRTELRKELNEQLAEMNILKALPVGIQVPSPSNGRKPGQEVN